MIRGGTEPPIPRTTPTQFILGSVRNIHLQQADDLLFFVRKAALATSRRNRLIVRRKGRHLPSDCAPGGTLCDAIDWPRSALLNMVLQTPYFLSVSACRYEIVHESCMVHGFLYMLFDHKHMHTQTCTTQTTLFRYPQPPTPLFTITVAQSCLTYCATMPHHCPA